MACRFDPGPGHHDAGTHPPPRGILVEAHLLAQRRDEAQRGSSGQPLEHRRFADGACPPGWLARQRWQETTLDTVVGIDVGGVGKGFHGVALHGNGRLTLHAVREAQAAAAWCRALEARVVAIDAPCQWSLTGSARAAEKALAALGIRTFATPRRAQAQGHPFYGWMLQGERLYEALRGSWRLFDGHAGPAFPLCCETFPHGVACALAGGIVPGKHKARLRRALLQAAGIDVSRLSCIDFVDAALCALAARALLLGDYQAHGDAREGFIVLPPWAEQAVGWVRGDKWW